MKHERQDKLSTLEEAAALVTSGSSLAAGGFAHSHQPMALVREIIRQGTSELTLIGMAECWVAEFLTAAGALDRTYMSNFMFEGFGRCQQFSQAAESGRLQTEDHSHFGVISRMVAAGLGVPFLPIRSMAGTDILNRPGFEDPKRKSARMTSPFDESDTITVVSPLHPDVALIHAARADRFGNVQLFGASAIVEEQVRAARRTVVSVEEVVDTAIIRQQPELTIIPGFMVDAIVHLPFGAHPTGVYGYYEHDQAHLEEYYACSRDAAAVRGFLDRYVRDLPDHWAYLDAFGAARLVGLRVDPALGYRDANGGLHA